MSATLVVDDAVGRDLCAASSLPLETAGVLLARLVDEPSGLRLLARRVVWAPESAYVDRQVDGMGLTSASYVPALGQAAEEGLLPIWLHTHPGLEARPTPSRRDAVVDGAIADLFRVRADTSWYATLILSPRPEGFAFTGRMTHDDGRMLAIGRCWAVGERWRLQRAFDAAETPIPPLFDRSVRAFGQDVQTTLGELRVAVVGCGGTGSAVCEQLVRLGVRRLSLFDVDVLSDSNVTRVYGSTAADVGRPKVEIAKQHLLSIAPDLDCATHQAMITLSSTARALAASDIVFGCTDDNAGRLVLSRLSTYLMTPVVDLGVLLSSDAAGRLTGIDGRVTVLSPSAACLVCRGRIDLARAAVEQMTPDERRRRQDEGYAPALGGAEPAVVTFTSAVAAAAVTEMLERLIGFGPEPRPSEILLRWHDREISVNQARPRPGHYCDPAAGKIGFGASEPFLEHVWPDA